MVLTVTERHYRRLGGSRPHRHSRPFGLLILGTIALVWLLIGVTQVPAADAWTKWSAYEETSNVTIDHSDWQTLLETYVLPGEGGDANKVDYAGFAASQADRDKLELYITGLEGVEVETLNKNEQFAFWANLYNAVTVRVILDHYPVSSIRKISISPGFFSTGPWGAKLVTVDGERLTLDDIEHRILRPIWKDPRVHYAVNCASIGCPNLPTKPFTGKTLEADLEAAARAYINSPRGATFEGNALRVSKIYNWYSEDFGKGTANLIAHLQSYAEGDLAEALQNTTTVQGYDYDWSLNDTSGS
jgi:uncharacterized protein DUF547